MGVDCTDNFFRKKAIEKTILRILRPSAFSHSLGHSATYRSIHVMSVLGPIADYFVANWQRRFKPTRHHVAGAGNHAPSSIWRAINGCRTPSGRDRIHVPDQDAALFVLLRASQRLPNQRRAG